ncbi:uncharacterized protein LOC112041643 [Lingula anatina]|uniref:Uncharacterized protein LOC112041643 n=1 Tax=Lingula anatina TaxID=7574 RepID=A0A2R2ML05_LINAN|nr:uncharacterized protein LOC112041643 [Lingula anatina]|eukprot:XP_023930889.1 uncharacterized protein LOC112041643 [Lingula anatina]
MDEKFNLALGKPTTQSSSHPVSYQSSLAVDGNNSTDASLCSRTYWETDPWWLVDLGGLYVIRSVVVIMPNNCPAHASIRMYVGNDTYNRGNILLPNVCAFEQTVDPPTLGRYIKISRSGPQSLVLCEVIVRGYTYPFNIALGKTASQSSNYSSGSLARLAVDGNTNTRFFDGSCTHTEENVELFPWWEVDLGNMYYIYSVTLVNREKAGRRLKNIEVKVSLPNNSVYHCARREEQVPGDSSAELPCNPAPLVGQFVRVSLNNTTPEPLTLCEVMVKGYKYQDCGSSKTFGPECRYKCNCKDTAEVCERRTGACTSGCADGWSNRQNVCQIECPFGKFGPLCEYTCHCLGDFTCSVTNGFRCPEGCQTYWKGYGCHQQRPYFDMAPTVTSRTLHSVSIGWDIWSSGRYPGEGSVRSYVARVWKDGNVIDVRKNSADITSITIENLLEYTAYEFTVSIEDEEGQEGQQSPSVAKMTCGAPAMIPQPDIIPSLKVPWNTAQIRLKTHVRRLAIDKMIKCLTGRDSI